MNKILKSYQLLDNLLLNLADPAPELANFSCPIRSWLYSWKVKSDSLTANENQISNVVSQ